MRGLLFASILFRRSLLGFAPVALLCASCAVRSDEPAPAAANAVPTAPAKGLPKEVEEVLAAHEATLAAIKTLHLKAAVRMNIHGGEMTLYDETEWWRVGDRERVAEVRFRDSEDGSPVDPPVRVESGYDPTETRRVRFWNSDDVRETPIVPRGADAATFLQAKGTILEEQSYLRHSLGKRLMFEFNITGLRWYLMSSDDVRLVSRDDEAITLKVRRPGCEAILQLAPKQGHLVRRVEYDYEELPPERSPIVMQVVEFAEGTAVPFPTKVTSGYGDDVGVETTVSDLSVNEPLAAEAATVRFPEGGQVVRHEAAKPVAWYVWGKGEPRLTFETQKEFDAWLSAAMKGAKED